MSRLLIQVRRVARACGRLTLTLALVAGPAFLAHGQICGPPGAERTIRTAKPTCCANACRCPQPAGGSAMTCCAGPSAPVSQATPNSALPETRVTAPGVVEAIAFDMAPAVQAPQPLPRSETSTPAAPPSGRQRLIEFCTSLT